MVERLKMENEVRIEFERFIDKFIKEPEKYLQEIESFLHEFGIEPDLKSILSYISGNAWGQFSWHNKVLEIEITPQIKNEYMEIMKRRSWELRETFIRARNK